MHAPPTAATPPVPRRAVPFGESGFTIAELLVAMVIIAILFAIAVVTFGGAKDTAHSKDAIVVGAAYDQAISRYQVDNANKLPSDGDMISIGATPAGPRNPLGKAYLPSIPDGVSAGRVGVSMDGTNCGTTLAAPTGAGAHSGWVSYCPEAAPNYAIRVITRRGPAWTDPSEAKLCWRGRTARRPAC